MIGRCACPDAHRLTRPLRGRSLDSYLAGTVRRDLDLAIRLARVASEQLARFDHGEAFGSPFDGFVATELLLRQQTRSCEEFELFHYRDRAGLEVNLVAALTGGRVLGIELQASTPPGRTHFDSLWTLRDRLGDRFVAGVVHNTGAEGYRYAERLDGLPIDALCSLGHL